MAIERPSVLLAAALASAMSLSAQTLQIPVIGYLASQQPAPPEQALVLKPVQGVPGAVVVGNPMTLPLETSALHLAPGHKFAVAQTGGRLVLALLNGDSLAMPQPLVGAEGAFDRVVFSATGSAFAAYSSTEKKLLVVRGLPASPQVAVVEDLSALNAGEFAAGAVSDDGQASFAAFFDGSSGSVWQFVSGGKPRLLVTAAHPAALAVRQTAGKSELVLADVAAKNLTLISWDDSDASSRVLATGPDGIGRPTFVQVSEDGNSAWMGDAGNNTILTVDLNTGVTSAVPSRVNPERITKVGGKSTYLIEANDGSSALWNADSLENKIWLLSAR